MAKLYVYGTQTNGNLGLTVGNDGTPVGLTQIGSDTDWESIAAAYYALAAVKGGKLYTCGASGFSYGLLGQGSDTGTQYEFSQVGVATDWKQVFGTQFEWTDFTATKIGGSLHRWGWNGYAGAATNTPTLEAGSGYSDVLGIANNGQVHLVFKENGEVHGYGDNFYGGLLGASSATEYNYPHVNLTGASHSYTRGYGDGGERNTFLLSGTDLYYVNAKDFNDAADTSQQLLLTNVAAISKQSFRFYWYLVKTDGTLWRVTSQYDNNNPTLDQVGSDTDWVECTTSGTDGANGCLASKTDGSLHIVHGGTGAKTEVVPAGDHTIVDFIWVTMAASSPTVAIAVLLSEAPAPGSFWTRFQGTEEI